MTTKRILIALLITSLLWGISCSTSNTEKLIAPKPDGPALISMFDDNVDSVTQSFTIASEAASEIMGTEGTTIKFPANIFKKDNGDAVTGNVKIDLIEIYKKSNMLITKKVTGGKDADGNIAMLISGGEFYVNATQDGNQLKLSGTYNILAPTNKTGEISQDMIQFNGVAECDGNDCKVIWEAAKDRGIKVGELQNTGGSYTVYSAFCGNFGWTNIDRWYSDPRTKTTIFVDVPDGYDNTNFAVFLSYDGEPTALARFDKYDADKKMFTEHYGLIPIGLNVHFIFVSIVDNKLKYAIQGATITENHVEAIGELKTLTEAELVALVDALP